MQKQLLPLLPACLLAVSASAAPYARFTDLRHAYVRGETARLHLDLKEMPAGAQVRFDVSGRLEQAVPASGAVTFTVDTALLRAADYDVRAVVTAGGREVASTSSKGARRCFPYRFPPRAANCYWSIRKPWGPCGSRLRPH